MTREEATQFIEEVKLMRTIQKKYFASKDKEERMKLLIDAKIQEKEVDKLLTKYTND